MGALLFNVIYGNQKISIYVYDTIYVTTYLGLSIIIVIIALLIFFIAFIYKKQKEKI